jgi:hypothetical protein
MANILSVMIDEYNIARQYCGTKLEIMIGLLLISSPFFWFLAKTKIIFDQGMGYWRPRMNSRADRAFDFDLPVTAQLLLMKDKISQASMLSTDNWPTFITVVNE